MKTYKFHFNTEYAVDLRDAVNDRQKQSLENMHNDKQTKGVLNTASILFSEYMHWQEKTLLEKAQLWL